MRLLSGLEELHFDGIFFAIALQNSQKRRESRGLSVVGTGFQSWSIKVGAI